MKPSVAIEYCPKCGWLLRSAYMAQELLTTFSEELQSVTLQPGEVSGGFTYPLMGKRYLIVKNMEDFLKLRN